MKLVVFLKPWRMYQRGEQAGFDLDTAEKLIAASYAVAADAVEADGADDAAADAGADAGADAPKPKRSRLPAQGAAADAGADAGADAPKPKRSRLPAQGAAADAGADGQADAGAPGADA